MAKSKKHNNNAPSSASLHDASKINHTQEVKKKIVRFSPIPRTDSMKILDEEAGIGQEEEEEQQQMAKAPLYVKNILRGSGNSKLWILAIAVLVPSLYCERVSR